MVSPIKPDESLWGFDVITAIVFTAKKEHNAPSLQMLIMLKIF